MKNHLPHQIDDNLDIKNGLSIQEIYEGLSALQKKEFPMRLLTKWVKSPTENGYMDWIDITQKNIFYKNLVASEHELIKKLPYALSENEHIQRIHSHSEQEPYIKKLVDEHKYLGYIENIVDIGCGDGATLKVLFDHLYNTHDDTKNTYPITLVDTSGLAVQNASIKFPKNPKTQIIGDVFDKNTNILGDKKNYHTLFTSLGRGYGNLSLLERKDLRAKLGPRGKFLISVFKVPTTEQQMKDSLKAYGDNTDGDNTLGYEVCKKQIWHMLEVLGFSKQSLDLCDFVVKWSDEDAYGNMNICVGFEPRQSLQVQYGQEKYIYDANTFYPLYHSERFTKEYFTDTVQHQYNGGDKIFALYENNDSMIIIEELQKSKNSNLKRKIKLGIMTILVALGMQQGVEVFVNHSENTSNVPQEVFDNTSKMLGSRGIYNVDVEKRITEVMPQILDVFYEGFNYHPHAKLDILGTDPITQDDKNSVLIPIIQNDLIKIAENSNDDIIHMNLYDIIAKIVDNNPMLFQQSILEKPQGWLKDITHTIKFTKNASPHIKMQIYDLIKTISLRNQAETIKALNKMGRESHYTYDFAGKEIIVYKIPISSFKHNLAIQGNHDSQFLLSIPLDSINKDNKTRHDILRYSQKQAAEMENLEYHFNQAIYGLDTGM